MVVTKETKKQDREVGRMSRRTAAWLAWSVCAVCVALMVLTLSLDFFTDDSFTSSGVVFSRSPGLAFAVLTGMLSLVFPAVGAIIASRLPMNPIGWIFCGVGLLYTTQRFTQAYANYALLVNFAFPGGEYMAWFSGLVNQGSLVLAGIFVMLLFPDGSLPSRRWRIVAWTAVCGALLTDLYAAFYPQDVGTSASVMNPFGWVGGIWVGVIGVGLTTYGFLNYSALIGETLSLTCILAAICSLALRLHRARGDERQQLKWFYYAAVPAALCFSVAWLSFTVVDFTQLVFGTPFLPDWAENLDNILYVGGVLSAVRSDLHLHRHRQVPPIRHKRGHKPYPRLRSSERLRRRDLRARGRSPWNPIPGTRQPRRLALGHGTRGRPLPAA